MFRSLLTDQYEEEPDQYASNYGFNTEFNHNELINLFGADDEHEEPDQYEMNTAFNYNELNSKID